MVKNHMSVKDSNNENSKKMRKASTCIIVIMILVLIGWIAWGNTALESNTYGITATTLPKEFDGYRIAHVSDLHNAEMGNGNEKLLEMLQKANPDIIAITGDLVDSSRTDIEVALQFVEKAVEIAPCYYVTGNHEAYIEKGVYNGLEKRMVSAGVTVLHDSEALLERAGQFISLTGVDDPDFVRSHGEIGMSLNPERIASLSTIESFTLLLSHRPEFFEQYASADVDLVLSGHAHGGQFRLPFVGGLAAPNQGLFPEYDAGLFVEGNTNMIVSRGIGNSVFPFRINNRPEVVIIELHQE